MASAEPVRALAVEVVFSPRAGVVQRESISLPEGSCVRDALRKAMPDLPAGDLSVGIWGRLVALDVTLRDRDRVEVYRPLLVDPKEARRQRHRERRSGAKLR